jgi:hypothetical protein
MCLATALWARQEADYFFISTKSATGEWKDIAFRKRDVSGRKVDEYIKEHADKDIYFCPHGFTHAHRRKDYSVLPRMLWADMDFVDPRKCKLRPTIAWESSPGRYVGLWLTDKTTTAELNKRLTYYLECDRGGWDLTQVVRVPGTVNYKYESHPKVRTLWDDGPTYKVSELEKRLPEVEMKEREEIKLPERLPIVDIDELSFAVKRKLRDCKAMKDRSQRLMHVAREMIKEGYDVGEIAAVLMTKGEAVSDHVWEQGNPRRAVARAIGACLGEAGVEDKTEFNGYRLFGTSLADIEEEDIDWLWYPFLARGELTILEGDPSIGKSFVIQAIGKAFCDGDVLPRLPDSGHAGPAIQGYVFYADCENKGSNTTKKRLRWAGLKHEQFFIQEELPFSIDDKRHMKMLYQRLEELKPIMVVFDTANIYIGGADSRKANEAAQAFMVFREIARRYDCSVVVLRHLTKASKKEKVPALYRGQGNAAVIGTARIVILVGNDPEDDEYGVMTLNKNNLVPKRHKHKGLTFIIEESSTLKEFDRGIFTWGEYKDVTSDEVLAESSKSNVKAIDAAMEWLKNDALKDGRIEVPRIEAMAKARNIAHATLYRAAKRLNVVRERQIPEGGNYRDRTMTWRLPNENKP